MGPLDASGSCQLRADGADQSSLIKVSGHGSDAFRYLLSEDDACGNLPSVSLRNVSEFLGGTYVELKLPAEESEPTYATGMRSLMLSSASL